MKRFLILLSLLFCNVVCADTINLHWLNEDGTTYQNSTCVIDSDLNIPTTPPTKYGYTFTGWKMSNYQPIEYIESTGSQYIDTGIIQSEYKQNLIIEMNVQFTNMTTYTKAFSSGCSSSTYFMPFNLLSTGYWSSNIGAGGSGIEFSGGDLNKHHVICNSVNGTLTIDNNTYNYSNNSANINKSIYLFANNGNSISPGKLRIYGVKFYTSTSELVRDFIPVLDKDGTPCMFDKVEAKFYYNQGTGQFIAGPSL